MMSEKVLTWIEGYVCVCEERVSNAEQMDRTRYEHACFGLGNDEQMHMMQKGGTRKERIQDGSRVEVRRWRR